MTDYLMENIIPFYGYQTSQYVLYCLFLIFKLTLAHFLFIDLCDVIISVPGDDSGVLVAREAVHVARVDAAQP